MDILKRFNALPVALLFHELSFILLVLTTLTVAVSWSIYWQRSSEESLRLSTINTRMQNIRGLVYRQLKEVFDASFLHDADAAREYQHYTDTIRSSLQSLHSLAQTRDEQAKITQIEAAYQAFYHDTASLFKHVPLNPTQRQELDKGLEQDTFVRLEHALSALHQTITHAQQAISDAKDTWASRLTLLAPIPILLSLALLFTARRYVQMNVVHPLSMVIAGANRIRNGDLTHPIPPSGVAELVRLAQAINEMAEELALHRDRLVEIKKQSALGELVPLVAHNIRNPLAGIRAAAQVARDETLNDQARETLSDIIIAVDRLECWVTSLLSYLHPVKPTLSHIKLTDVADNALVMIELQLADKAITVEKQGWDQASQYLDLDIHLFEQAIFNLLQNALEASKAGDTIHLIYQQDHDRITLAIHDQGKGIMFDPLADNPETLSQKKLSCGLGIPFANKVIVQHHGTLHFARRETGGTTVTLTFKRSQTDPHICL